MRKGLTSNIETIIEAVSELECIKPYVLVGGTALAMQLGHRLSEDLDFMMWKDSAEDKPEVDWPAIKKELEEKVAAVGDVDILGFDHVLFVVGGVKLSFYVSEKKCPVLTPIPYMGNIRLADRDSILAMKLEVMLRRIKFRDYYDIYAIVKDGADLDAGIDRALKYSGFRLRKKNVIALLLSGRYDVDRNFTQLSPKYDVKFESIREYLLNELKSVR